MRFYLGTHKPQWLPRVTVPLFVSHRRLAERVRLPQAATTWALDSGAFTEVAGYGRFVTTPADYVAAIRRYRDEVGRLAWAAPQDHMVEPWVLARSTIASTVTDAQRWTVDNFVELRTLAAELDIVPVLQGWTVDDYRRHIDQYAAAGVDLELEPLVGLGSVCRRQSTEQIAAIIGALAPLPLHGFGVKSTGLRRYGAWLSSADSMAWSYNGRRIRPCPEKPSRVSCSNCMHHALAWRHRVVDAVADRPLQLELAP